MTHRQWICQWKNFENWFTSAEVMIKHQVYHCFPEHDVEWSITSEHAATSACTHALYGRTPDETTPVQWLALQTDRQTDSRRCSQHVRRPELIDRSPADIYVGFMKTNVSPVQLPADRRGISLRVRYQHHVGSVRAQCVTRRCRRAGWLTAKFLISPED